ncbi:MAG TPA: hypothetical protein VFX16_30465 [Pseudonocardiaceae bacterium]|nr:hypothetical protein [Pseudonocardiaceae bacterium]
MLVLPVSYRGVSLGSAVMAWVLLVGAMTVVLRAKASVLAELAVRVLSGYLGLAVPPTALG